VEFIDTKVIQTAFALLALFNVLDTSYGAARL
jgi:hypothetical protein